MPCQVVHVKAHTRRCPKRSSMKKKKKKAVAKPAISRAGSGSGAGAAKKKKKRIKPMLVSASVGGGSSFGAPASGGTKAQKKYQKKLNKIAKKYGKLKGNDADPKLAF